MNYKDIYEKFILKYRSQTILQDTYYEKHHIIPKSHGGSDESINLILLTYRQHVFAHRLLWKAYGKASDLMAYRLMSGMDTDVRKARQSANGKANVVSGHMDRIRSLANTKIRQEKLAEMNKLKWESGEGLKATLAANEAWRGCNHTDEFKINRSIKYKERFRLDKWKLFAKDLSAMGREARTSDSVKLSEKVLSTQNPNEEFLLKTSNRSKNLFVSPTGLTFQSPIYAAEYFNNTVRPHVIENWCKRGQHGWKRITKTEQ